MKTEKDYFSQIVPGVLYSVGPGGINRWHELSCPLTGGPCRESCRLYVAENGKCKYKLSLESTDEKYRFIDNELLFESSTLHPCVEQVPEKALVVGKEVCVASQCPQTSPPSTLEDEVDNELLRVTKRDKEVVEK